ncbi:MAG TPA: hypothetical protein VLA24_14630 [Pseudomonadales bacterium]|nr:hypothetical protein [Pseudomonadales bacterium]
MKRITVCIDDNVDNIRTFIQEQTGVKMTYVQVIDHLIHFYIKHANEPRTKWTPMVAQIKTSKDRA